MEKILNKILVPIDGSKTSHNALNYATKLAKSSDAHVHLVNVVDLKTGDEEDIIDNDRRIHRAEYILKEAEAITKREGVEASSEIAYGPVPETILSIAQEMGFDLIVMGNRGMSKYKSMLGHVSEKVAKGAHCPVVLV